MWWLAYNLTAYDTIPITDIGTEPRRWSGKLCVFNMSTISKCLLSISNSSWITILLCLRYIGSRILWWVHVCVCVYFCTHISWITVPNLTKLYKHVTSDRCFSYLDLRYIMYFLFCGFPVMGPITQLTQSNSAGATPVHWRSLMFISMPQVVKIHGVEN